MLCPKSPARFLSLPTTPRSSSTERKCLCVSSYIEARPEDSGSYGFMATDGVACVERLTFQMSTRQVDESLLYDGSIQKRDAVEGVITGEKGLVYFNITLTSI
jgi:hypothetical protein